jgi:hypothetical protein
VGLQADFGIALQVLADPRIIFITLAVLFSWAALRYVGMVYHKRPKAAPSKPPVSKAAKKAAAKKTAPSPASEEDEVGEGMIE